MSNKIFNSATGRWCVNLAGRRFGSLVVVEISNEKSVNNETLWICKCDCGNIKNSISGSLIHGGNKSCGCKGSFVVKGESKTRLKIIWDNMIARCYSKKSDSYSYCGSNGIVVCEEWRSDFFSFKKWAISSGYNDSLTLDRFPNRMGNYEPSNCRWATVKEQQNNRRSNLFITFNGETKTAKEWSEAVNIPYATLTQRITKLKWPHDKALTTPFRNAKKMKNGR